MSNKAWIGVDLDGTLAFYDRWRGEAHIGAPIPAMLGRVKSWLAEGKEVRVFTARADYLYRVGETPPEALTSEEGAAAVKAIRAWCVKHIGQELAVTCLKDYQMIELWDDRAIQVIPNTGRSIADELEAERTARKGTP